VDGILLFGFGLLAAGEQARVALRASGSLESPLACLTFFQPTASPSGWYL